MINLNTKLILFVIFIFIQGCIGADKTDKRFQGNWLGKLISIKEHRYNDYQGEDLEKLLEQKIETEYWYDSTKVCISDSVWKFIYPNDSTINLKFFSWDEESDQILLIGKIQSYEIFESYKLTLKGDTLFIDWVSLPMVASDTVNFTLGGDISFKRVYYELIKEKTSIN